MQEVTTFTLSCTAGIFLAFLIRVSHAAELKLLTVCRAPRSTAQIQQVLASFKIKQFTFGEFKGLKKNKTQKKQLTGYAKVRS